MDLDELKSQLKHKLATDHAGRSGEDFAQLLQKRTQSTVGKLKNSLLFEIRLGIPSVVLFWAIAFFSGNPVLRDYFYVFAVLIAVTTAILVHLYNKTKRLGDSPLPVKQNLQEIVTIIDEFVKRCFQMAVLMVPLAAAFMVLLQYHYKPGTIIAGEHHTYLTTPVRLGAFIVVFVAVFTVLVYFFARWYLYKLYGRYTAQLKECIAELEE